MMDGACTKDGFECLADRVARWQAAGDRVVLCHGCFDPLHPGHLLHFQAARRQGDRLVVTVTPDRYVGKPGGRPLFPEGLRLAMVQELRIVDAAALNLWPSAVETIRRLRPAVLAKGADYHDRARCNPNIADEEEAVRRAGGELHYTDEWHSSSTWVVDRLRRDGAGAWAVAPAGGGAGGPGPDGHAHRPAGAPLVANRSSNEPWFPMKYGELLRSTEPIAPPLGGDFVERAVREGMLRPFAEGQWLYSGSFVSVFRRLQSHYVSEVRRRLGFEEWIFPRLIPRRAFESFQLSHFRPDILFGAGPFERPGEYDLVLDPVQCIPLYEHLRGRTLAEGRLPLRVVECLGGWTWRNETSEELSGPSRAREFARVECVFVGAPDQVRTLRRSVEEVILELLSDLGLNWRTVVGVGCMDISSLTRATEEAASEDGTPIHDVELLTGPDRWLEVAGCTVEGNHLIERFDIRRESGGPLWSGCCGLGYNRLVVCLFLQHGFDLAAWPRPVRGLCGLD